MYLNDRFYVLHSAFSIAYFKECADDGTHHISEETVGCDDEGSFRDVAVYVGFFNTPIGLCNRAEECLHIGFGTGERLKILLADKAVGGLVHLVEIEPFSYACARSYVEWVFQRGDTVLVGA